MAAMSFSLYHYFGCPFCTLVRRAADQLGLRMELRDILESPDRRRELVAATGRQTVPCLRIESEEGEVQWMHESRDIIDYLKSGPFD
jgi:glutathione S-transferase